MFARRKDQEPGIGDINIKQVQNFKSFGIVLIEDNTKLKLVYGKYAFQKLTKLLK